MSTYNTHLEIDGVEDVPITVTYTAVPFRAGSREGGTGLKMEPDEEAHIEIEGITISDGREITPTTKEETTLEEEIMDWLNGRYDEPDPDDAWDRKIERERLRQEFRDD